MNEKEKICTHTEIDVEENWDDVLMSSKIWIWCFICGSIDHVFGFNFVVVCHCHMNKFKLEKVLFMPQNTRLIIIDTTMFSYQHVLLENFWFGCE